MDRLRGPLEDWLRRHLGPASLSVTAVSLFPGGASNITCRVDLEEAGRPAAVLRLQRNEGIFAPYDVLREGRVLSALGGAPFPVPAVLASEPDPGPLGAPFLILEYVDAPHMGEPGVEADFGAFVRAVTQIHSLEWQRHGLGFLGVPSRARDALAGELSAVVRRMSRFGSAGDPLLSDAKDMLGSTIPADGVPAFCQGDINVFNYLFRRGRLAAVVDWEQARISDPRSDIGQLVALSHLKGAAFCQPRELGFVAAYEGQVGREVSGLEWFRAFWLFQLAVIYQGWVAFSDTEPWYSREQVDSLLQLALSELS